MNLNYSHPFGRRRSNHPGLLRSIARRWLAPSRQSCGGGAGGRLLAVLAASGLCVISEPAFAFTECRGNIERIWAGDNATWIFLKGSGSAVVPLAFPNTETVVALAMTALVSSREIIVRYEADDVDCGTWARNDFAGMYML